MFSEYWILSAWMTKVALYLGMAFVIGGAFSYCLFHQYPEMKTSLIRYMTLGALLGLISSSLGFFIQIGSFANQGIAGMWDSTYFNILVNTSIGMIQILRFICFAIILVLLLIKLRIKPEATSSLEVFLLTVFLLPIVISFSQLGHTINLTLTAQSLLTLHVLAMSLWMGALFPLWKFSQVIKGIRLKESMRLFGHIAVFIVGILIFAGGTVAFLLFKDIDILLNTPYGHGFIVKILLVLSILVLAAFNKWYFTPRLENPKFAKQFGYAILFEMVLGLAILLQTGYITSVIGID